MAAINADVNDVIEALADNHAEDVKRYAKENAILLARLISANRRIDELEAPSSAPTGIEGLGPGVDDDPT